MLKPSAVTLRLNLWKLYFANYKNLVPPKFGLNFLKDEQYKNRDFLLICGFEKFEKFYIRIDILERLFLLIMENIKKGKFKMIPEMLNLIGCSKENFIKLLKLMDYKHSADENKKEDFFTYKPKKNFNKKNKINEKYSKDSPFQKLSRVNFR